MSDRDDPRQVSGPAPGGWPPPPPGPGAPAPRPEPIEWAAPPRPRRPAGPGGHEAAASARPPAGENGHTRGGPFSPLQDATVPQAYGAGADRTQAMGGSAGATAAYGSAGAAGPYGGGGEATQAMGGSTAATRAYGGGLETTQSMLGSDRTLAYDGGPQPTRAYGGVPPPPASPTYGYHDPSLPPPGAPPGYGAPSPYLGPTGTRHRPGIGAVLGLAGVAALVAALLVLPWASAGGEDVTFQDVREAGDEAPQTPIIDPSVTSVPTTGLPGTDPSASVPPGGAPGSIPSNTVPGTDPGSTMPSIPGLNPGSMPSIPPFPGAGGPGAGGTADPGTATTGPQGLRQQVPVTPEPAADTASGGFAADYLEAYVDWVWLAVIGAAALAVLFSTLLVPSGRGARCFTGLLAGGLIGLLANAADRGGRVGPRVAGFVGVGTAAGAHGYALYEMFGHDASPDPGLGVWVSAGGLAVALLACLIGARTESG